MSINLLDAGRRRARRLVASLDEKPFRRDRSSAGYTASANRNCADERYRKPLRESSCGPRALGPPQIVSDSLARDGTRKWLLDVGNGNAIEAVYIPGNNRGTLCISTQAGCTSPASSARPAGRDSTAISRCRDHRAAVACQRELGATPGGERVISNGRVDGMGEPLLNFDNTVRR